VESSRLQSIETPQRRNWRWKEAIAAGVEAERVVAHRMDDPKAVAPLVVGDCVADRVDLEVADVGLAGGIGQHLEHVGLRLRLVEAGLTGVGNLPGVL